MLKVIDRRLYVKTHTIPYSDHDRQWQCYLALQPKPAVTLEDCQREYCRVNRTASPQRSRYTEPSLFCTVQTWVLYRNQFRLLDQFHQRCLRSILGVKWQDYLSNKEVLKRASLPSTEFILLQVQLRWAGHVKRMEDVRMPKAVFLSEFQEVNRDQDASWKRYKDQLKRQLAQEGLSHQSW